MISVPQNGEKSPIPLTRPLKAGRFGRLPESAYGLCEEGRLIARDLQLLGWLMRRTAPGNPIVTERQPSLAKRLRCAVKTIQRALARLEECGLLVRLYVRDAWGRLHGRGYDLAGTLALMPQSKGLTTKATPMTDGKPWPGGAGYAQKGRVSARRQSDSGDQLKESPEVCQGDNRTHAAAADPAIVVDLVALGVLGPTARSLARAHDDRRIQEVIAAAKGNGRRSLAGWIVAALTGKWNVGPRVAAPKSQSGRQESLPRPATPLITRERKRLGGKDLGVAELLGLCGRIGGYEAVLGEMERVIEWREREGPAPAPLLAIYKRVLVASQSGRAEERDGS